MPGQPVHTPLDLFYPAPPFQVGQRLRQVARFDFLLVQPIPDIRGGHGIRFGQHCGYNFAHAPLFSARATLFALQSLDLAVDSPQCFAVFRLNSPTFGLQFRQFYCSFLSPLGCFLTLSRFRQLSQICRA